jgi:glycerol-3-phosphate cytidylyltransferase
MKIGITFSAFDLLHAGHVAMLEEAKGVCDYLIVGLHIDPSLERSNKNKPIQSLIERQIQLKGCKYVDEIICYETEQDLLNLLNMVKWHVRIIGEEYKGKAFTGWTEFDKPNSTKEIYYNSRRHGFSSTDLRQRFIND